MSDSAYLIVHKDHLLNAHGVNGGAETATLWISRSMAAMGRRVIVAGQLAHPECTKDGVEFWDIGPDFDVQSALVRARQLKSYHLIATCRALAIQLSRNETCCVSRHFIAHDPSAGAIGIKASTLSRLVDGMVCVSEAQKALFVTEGADAAKITVIPNGANREVFKPTDFATRDLKRITFAGALVQDKGIDILVRAFVQVKKAIPDAALDIYGSAGLWGREEIFNPREVEAQVPGIKFHGSIPQTELAKAFGNSGVNVVASRWFDAFNLTLVEAQSTGCPVVAFDVGGIKEAFVPGRSGVLIPEVSEQALAETLISLLKNPATLKSMSSEALKVVEERFTWEKSARKFVELCEKGSDTKAAIEKPLGIISTWNQDCGLATYARFLFGGMPSEALRVFSEITKEPLTASDEEFVTRCWSADSSDYSKLERTILDSGVGLLHINCHSISYFPHDSFWKAIENVRRGGVKVVCHLHSTFSHDPRFSQLFAQCDRVIVHAAQNRLELIANGARAEQVSILPHGVRRLTPLSEAQRNDLRQSFGLKPDEQAIVCFGFVQPHKGIEGMLEGVALLTQNGRKVRGFVVGEPHSDDMNSKSYQEWLKVRAKELGVADRVTFLERFVADDEVQKYLQAADLIFMNYRSQHYEASGAGSLAIGAGGVVCASLAPPFEAFGDAVWRLTAGYPVPQAIAMLLENPTLRATIREKAMRFAEQNDWPQIGASLQTFYRSEFGFIPKAAPKKATAGQMKVLIQNRPNTFTQAGGDTIVIERTRSELERLGVHVTIDVNGHEDPKNFNIVHLFNFALPDVTKYFAERAKNAGVPYVVTTLCEDVPSFHMQSHAVAAALVMYQREGQNKAFWQQHQDAWRRVKPAARFDNDWTAQNAAALLPNGRREADVLRRDYPNAKNIMEVPLGFEVSGAASVGPELFVKTHGVKDFVLCVGRLESRKNQLMLLKALEDSDIPVVLASGGFTYQPDYADACRNFKRKGKTLVLERLSPEMLASAYAAAKVHALPSWYELPGLVSLEAASYGCQVVVTDNGTARDYFGDLAFYCEPHNEASVKNAVLTAFNTPARPALQKHVAQYRWDAIGANTLKVYNAVLGASSKSAPLTQGVFMKMETNNNQSPTGFGAYDHAPGVTDFQEHLDRGEMAARNGDLTEAHSSLAKAEQLNANSVRVLKARGTVYLAENNVSMARSYFDRAMAIEPNDARVLCGIGMCEIRKERVEIGYGYIMEALKHEPNSPVAIQQLIVCAYTLSRFNDLERILRTFCEQNPSDIEMQYCLGGCLYRLSRFAEAVAIAESVLKAKPDHRHAGELLDMAKKAQPQTQTPTRPAQMVEKIAIPSTNTNAPSMTAQPSTPTVDASIDMELGKLEEAKRRKSFSEVRQGAETILTRAGTTPEQREVANCLRAEVSVLEGDNPTAEGIYRQVLDVNPSSARALCGRAVMTANQGNWEEARGLFERANTFRPHYDLALAGLGLCAWQAGDSETAWIRFSQAVKANPENTRALLGLIQIGYPLKRYAEIEEAVKGYLELHPADLEWLYSLAGVCFAQDKLDEATDALRQITLFQPNHDKASELQGMIERRRAGEEVLPAELRA